jgi:hypothetical protein
MKTTILSLILMLVKVTSNGQLILAFSGENNLSVGPGCAGYDFVEGTLPQTLGSLGVWDASGTGLTELHRVGLWDFSTQTLLASVVVVPGTAVEIGSFWYQALAAPVTLEAGHHYVLGAQYSDNSLDLAAGNATSVTINGIALGDARLSSGTGFEFPDLDVSGANRGFFGANGIGTAVPEPPAWGFVTSGIMLALVLYRRATV